MTPTKRPSASEIVELLSNTPRLIAPCVDVPLASVQVERTDSLEMIPSVRKPSGSVSQTNKPTLNSSIKRVKDYSGSSGNHIANPHNGANSTTETTLTAKSTNGGYSSMSGFNSYNSQNGIPNTDISHNHLRIDLPDTIRQPLLPSLSIDRGSPPPIPLEDVKDWPRSSSRTQNCVNGSVTSSYVPPGYIIVDHTKSKGAVSTRNNHNFDDYVSSSNQIVASGSV